MTTKAVNLSMDQQAAFKKYRRDYVGAINPTVQPDARVSARQELELARKELTPVHVALMNQLAGLGKSTSEVAKEQKAPITTVEVALFNALHRLAAHYQERAGA